MSPEKIETLVLGVLKTVQGLSGHAWADFAPANRPIGDLEGFDSLCSIEATVMVEQALGVGSLGISSLFISEDGKNALTVREISERIHKVVSTTQGK